jgi:hypothetical protein
MYDIVVTRFEVSKQDSHLNSFTTKRERDLKLTHQEHRLTKCQWIGPFQHSTAATFSDLLFVIVVSILALLPILVYVALCHGEKVVVDAFKLGG